jgi:hypothetical protein
LSPLRFGLSLFLSEVFCFEPLAFLGYLFFHQRSFVLSQRTKVAIPRLHSRLWLTWRNSLLSNTELALLAILMMMINVLGKRSLYYCFEVT